MAGSHVEYTAVQNDVRQAKKRIHDISTNSLLIFQSKNQVFIILRIDIYLMCICALAMTLRFL